MIIRSNLGGVVSNISRGQSKARGINQATPIGKVYGVITTPNTPTKELYEKYGGETAIGTIFYMDYNDVSKNNDTPDYYNTVYKVAKPYFSNIQDYPLIGELVVLTSGGPSPDTQNQSNQNQVYYLGAVNLWNNPQQNAPSGDSLGKTFSENADIRNLLAFEGDRIYQGRKGNGIRFGSTVKYHSDLNEWSSVGNDGDPIMIIANGYITTDTGSLAPNIEEINKEESSIYLTTTQLLPLIPDRKDILNPLTKPVPPNKYTFAQSIINSDRITLNSKKDEVMTFAKTNVEINTNNIINLNARSRVHLNTPHVFLGTKSNGKAPTEPLLLGNKTKSLLTELLSILSELGNTLTSVVTTPQGSPLTGVNTAGTTMVGKIKSLQKQLKGITSKNNFTI
jgi:hypothetical protein